MKTTSCCLKREGTVLELTIWPHRTFLRKTWSWNMVSEMSAFWNISKGTGNSPDSGRYFKKYLKCPFTHLSLKNMKFTTNIGELWLLIMVREIFQSQRASHLTSFLRREVVNSIRFVLPSNCQQMPVESTSNRPFYSARPDKQVMSLARRRAMSCSPSLMTTTSNKETEYFTSQTTSVAHYT